METTMVEVTLAQFAEETKQPKACWYPFQKQRNHRRSKSWDVDKTSNTKLANFSGLRLCTSSSAEKNADRKERLHHKKKKSKKKTGSVSTDETDTSFLSEETRTTARTLNSSSQGTYRVNSAVPSSSQTQRLYNDQNSVAGYSYQTNNSIADTQDYPSPTRYNQSPLRFNQRVRVAKYNNVNATNPKGDYRRDNESVDMYKSEKLAEVDTNCMSTDFWTDEAYACAEARNKKKQRDQERASPNKHTDVTIPPSPKGVDGLESSVPNGSKTELPPTATSGYPFEGIMRFVSQDPEDSNNDGAPLRRFLCSSAPFRNGARPVLCQVGGPASQNQDGRDKDIFQVLHKHNLEEEEPNFYVEVEAMRDQLNKIRDLDEFESETNQRAPSLVDIDIERSLRQKPRFMDHVRHDSVDSAIDARARAHIQREKERNQRHGAFVPTRTNVDSRLAQVQRKEKFRNRIRERIGRKNLLLSEMVTDRVLSMRVGNEGGSSLMGSGTRNDFEVRQSTFKTTNQGHGRRVEFVDHGPMSTSLPSNRSPPKEISPTMTAASQNPLNVSELTDASPDPLVSGFRTNSVPTNNKHMPVGQSSSANIIQARVNDEKKEEWYESDIGYYRKPSSPSRKIVNTASSPQRDNGVDGEKFDDNFWQEDDSDINTATFEQFGSEGDSVFDDLRSGSSAQVVDPKGTKAIFESFEKDYQQSFGPEIVTGQGMPAKPTQRFTMGSDHERQKGKRTTYLQ